MTDTDTKSYVYQVKITAVIYTARPLGVHPPAVAQEIIAEHLDEIPLGDPLGADVQWELIDTLDSADAR